MNLGANFLGTTMVMLLLPFAVYGIGRVAQALGVR